ncbi:MAG: hypothetical protein ACREQF_01785, partial [Candidatus Binataceae bacterium]
FDARPLNGGSTPTTFRNVTFRKLLFASPIYERFELFTRHLAHRRDNTVEWIVELGSRGKIKMGPKKHAGFARVSVCRLTFYAPHRAL